jgi:hypothetical protein
MCSECILANQISRLQILLIKRYGFILRGNLGVGKNQINLLALLIARTIVWQIQTNTNIQNTTCMHKLLRIHITMILYYGVFEELSVSI